MPYTKLTKSTLIMLNNYKEPNPSIEGWVTSEELRWLYDQACRYKTILEVGSWKGRSTHALLSSGHAVIAVDTFKGSKSEIDTWHSEAKEHDIFPEFILNVGHFTNLSVLRMDSSDASDLFCEESVDMIFLDGDHEYTFFKKDFLIWNPKHKHLFCGHDLKEGGTKKVLEEFHLKYERGPGSLWRLI